MMPFQSTRPIRGATLWCGSAVTGATDFNPRAPYGARHNVTSKIMTDCMISIHAPHTGRDRRRSSSRRSRSNFNPRAPYGARPSAILRPLTISLFQSTRPIRGATLQAADVRRHPDDFNPRAPYGARRAAKVRPRVIILISIHAPHTGRDLVAADYGAPTSRFQSTRPIRGATLCGPAYTSWNWNFNPRAPYGARHQPCLQLQSAQKISIHAPHTGRDPGGPGAREGRTVFQSTRPIRGATRAWRSSATRPAYFNPRAPYGARHSVWRLLLPLYNISIHAPHTGRDHTPGCRTSPDPDFNPRAPYGARLLGIPIIEYPANISIHAPHTGRDAFAHSAILRCHIFQSTRPIRGATDLSAHLRLLGGISIHAPHTGRDRRSR